MTPTRKARPRTGAGIQAGQQLSGWLFIAPVVLLLGLFLLVPVLMAAWVSVSDWTGRGSPFASDVSFVGADNYTRILVGGGLDTQDFGTALRNNFYYVLLVVPLQTALALFLAVLVSQRMLRGRGFFRTAFYFPSVTSSVAITVLWLFLFSATGVVNKVLSWVSIDGPNWFSRSPRRAARHPRLVRRRAPHRPPWRRPTSWGSRCGSGWPVRRWRCRRSS